MKHRLTALFLSLSAAVALSSCASGPNAQTGTVLGALGGAAVGGIVGHQSGRGLEGAAIGGGLGAQDQRNSEYYYRQRERDNYYRRSNYQQPRRDYYY